jgi:nucleoid-associated protein YgaU
MKSRDKIYPEQKLVIPPLTAYLQDSDKAKSVFSTAMFKKVKSIGQQHLLDKSRQTKKSEIYTVCENDNLWRIAAEKLGDGNRYTEIAKMNADILDDEDNLAVGLRLKLPVR